ncbi:ArsR/SmtB family transcription factor [Gynurincola endophyticus]|uniref:ArsR/SmtB family transcription factor n=1 Tax=Gynurincola endophyticus TaxID=2479004 RepID=UPI000F8C5911|nr:metalloregulator ArsR/SmtB family transcription factor [Gynurincola endophyticus]
MRRDVFQAIADPTRRAIIFLLAVQSMTPNDLATHFKTTRQAVSKHLQVLADCDLVKQEPQGRTIVYHLQSEKMKEIEVWLEKFRSLLDKRFGQLDQVLEQLKNQKQ